MHRFRAQCSRFRSFGDSVVQLCAQLVAKGAQDMARPAAPATAAATRAAGGGGASSTAAAAADATKLPRRDRLEFFRTPAGVDYRNRTDVPHRMVLDDPLARGRCVVCCRVVCYFCLGCRRDDFTAFLCRKRRPLQSCFDAFHSAAPLPARVSPKPKTPPSGSAEE